MQKPLFLIKDYSGDLKITSSGQDELEVIAHASLGLLSQITNPELVEEREQRVVKVSGEGITEQAIAFLNELIFLAYGELWITKRVVRMSVCSRKDCKELEAILAGEPVDKERHEFKYDIKAVTYHNFRLEQKAEMFEIELVCDL